MPLIAAFMVPHPLLAIPEIGKGKESQLAATVSSFEFISRKVASLAPEVIVWVSPHAESYADCFQLADGEVGVGSFAEYNASNVTFRMLYDKELTRSIAYESKILGVPVSSDNSWEGSIDRGTLVPLYFINHEYRDFLSVRTGVSGLSLAAHYRYGQAIGAACAKSPQKIVLIASGDLSHCLSRESLNGYRPEGVQYDEQMMRLMGKANFGELLSFNRFWLQEAAQCGHRAFTILAGALDRHEVEAVRLTHESPFGVGCGFCQYIVGAFDASRSFLDLYETREALLAKERREKADLYVRLARQAMETYVTTGRVMKLSSSFPPALQKRKAGVFVTIQQEGELRGCLGSLKPRTKCVGDEIIQNAIAAATKDRRFEPIQPSDFDRIVLTVDVIQNVIPILSASDLDPAHYGVMVEMEGKHASLLPGLPGVDTPEKQVEIAKRKAGIPVSEEPELFRFETEHHE